MKKVYWTFEAEETYLDIVEFLLESWGVEIVEKFQQILDARINDLRVSPHLGKVISEHPFRQLVIHQNVSIYYRVYDEYVLLLAVWDNRQNPKRLSEILDKRKRSRL